MFAPTVVSEKLMRTDRIALYMLDILILKDFELYFGKKFDNRFEK